MPIRGVINLQNYTIENNKLVSLSDNQESHLPNSNVVYSPFSP